MSVEKIYLNAKEAAQYLGKSVSTLHKLTSKKKLKFYRPDNGNLMFTKEDLDNYVKGVAA